MEKNTKLSKLKDHLNVMWEEVHLMHEDVDSIPHTIVELHDSTLTATGKEAWSDVLNANVNRIYTGIYGTQIELSHVKASRVEAFGAMLAGYCSVQDYEKWVVDNEEIPAQTQKIN